MWFACHSKYRYILLKKLNIYNLDNFDQCINGNEKTNKISVRLYCTNIEKNHKHYPPLLGRRKGKVFKSKTKKK